MRYTVTIIPDNSDYPRVPAKPDAVVIVVANNRTKALDLAVQKSGLAWKDIQDWSVEAS